MRKEFTRPLYTLVSVSRDLSSALDPDGEAEVPGFSKKKLQDLRVTAAASVHWLAR